MKMSLLSENDIASTLAKASGLSVIAKMRSNTSRQTAGGNDGFGSVGGRQYGSSGIPSKPRHRKFLGCGQRPGAITPPGV